MEDDMPELLPVIHSFLAGLASDGAAARDDLVE
jgi:hypothetical protein